MVGPPDQCFDKLQHVGDGLQLQKYDGCVGWLASPFCENAALFSESYLAKEKLSFLKLKSAAKMMTGGKLQCSTSSASASAAFERQIMPW